jgi:hypothetical protein
MALLGWGVAGCDKGKEMSSEATKGQESVVRLTIYDQRPTRGTGDTETASATESAVSGTAKVIVFQTDGTFEKEVALPLTGTGPYVTDHFTLGAGTKYLYVFFNDATRNDIPSGSGKTRAQFEKSVFEVAFDATTSLPDIAADNSFLIGTAYGEAHIVAGGGTVTTPVALSLSVGRAVSKVNVAEVKDQAGTGMAGSFSSPSYRIGSLAKKVYVVGQYTLAAGAPAGTMPPAAGGKWTAFSAVHDEAAESTPGTYNSAAFLQYTALWKSPTAAFYVPENTTKEDPLGYIYYGNTSYVQVKTKYTPAAAEVLDPTDLSKKLSLASNGDFWTVQLNDMTRVIVGIDPTTAVGTLDPKIDQTKTYHKYANGWNYHKFAIYDDDPALSSSVQKYSVLRNTYYEYKVTDILSLGSYTDTVNPIEPVPTDTEIELSVTIKPWFKIADNVTL